MSLLPFSFELKVFDPTARSIEQRQLGLILNDSDTVRVGSMQSQVQHWPGSSEVAQNLAAILPANAFHRLSRSTSAEVDLSGTRYLIPPEVLRDFRALYVGVLCGVRP